MNVDRKRVEAARARQSEVGCPLFVTLADEGLILREPGLELVQHYGKKLFSQLWTDRVRFAFEQQELPAYAHQLPATEDNIDQWVLSTLRFVQYQELEAQPMTDMASIPAYTRDGYERVQQLRLTVAEAQFASQFNGSRSILQITKNLRLDVKFTRLTLFALSRTPDRGMLAGSARGKTRVARWHSRDLQSLGDRSSGSRARALFFCQEEERRLSFAMIWQPRACDTVATATGHATTWEESFETSCQRPVP